MNYRWVKLAGTDLVPGDVVSIGRSSGQTGEDKSVPADMLILGGSAIVNEAILTGESTPQWKVVFFFFLQFSHDMLCGYIAFFFCFGGGLHLPGADNDCVLIKIGMSCVSG